VNKKQGNKAVVYRSEINNGDEVSLFIVHVAPVSWAAALQSPFLLLLRLYFFWQLFLTGKGKLANIVKVSEFFASLGIPLPTLNAYFIGSLECFGSLLLIIGLGSQPLALLIVLSMVVAYLTADFEAVSSMFSDPDKFAKADPRFF
jgi:putative oxidoreductase